ncbi:PREDICTED: receptor-type tyrosine-protein phosphatase zeta isoform X2 [Nanorana parkeri]|uniref:receptor-type tyrosine-protein phosphatase zeta isoform X2 n=1 Tax=Nanorana parkeri TaxID=125878 RepID=UPI0008549648|nr:PREDICTED: receptor-type tyrosine-protein phosphatase zeta isoform X2 [Nanorana parkeri]
MEMLNLRCVLACLQLLFICQVGLIYGYRQQRKLIAEIDWSYTESFNQTNWMKKYPACNGARQSPINIDEKLTQLNMNLKKLTFQGWEQVSNNTLIRNTGKTVEINLTGDYYLSGGALDTAYRASRIHFHWGKCNATSDGSEHSLEGQKFPLEMQIFCFNANQFGSLDDAIKGNGRVKALSVLFKIGEENKNYEVIIDGVDRVHRFGKKAELEPFVLLDLLPSYTDKYYTYNGSLTTPPCSETAEWIVFKDTVTISQTQLEFFCEILTMQQSGYVMVMDYLQNNFRHQQHKFSGQVFASYTGTEEIHEPVCSSEPEDVQAEAQNSTSLLITWKRPRVVYDAVIDRYVVYYQKLQGEDQTKHQYLTDGYQDLGAILLNLVPNTSYVLQVVAMCTNSLYGKRSDQVVLDMMMDGQGNDPYIDVTETEEEIEDSNEDMQEKSNNIYELTSRTISTKNQLQVPGTQETTVRNLEEMTSQPYKTTQETLQLHEHRDSLKTLLYPTLQSTSKTYIATTTDMYKEVVKTIEQEEDDEDKKSTELKSRVDIWMLNDSVTTKSPSTNDAQTSAVNDLSVTSTSWRKRILMPTRRPPQIISDTSVTASTTFSATLTPDETSQADPVSSQAPEEYTSENIPSSTYTGIKSVVRDDNYESFNATSQPQVYSDKRRLEMSLVVTSDIELSSSSQPPLSSSPSEEDLEPSTVLPEMERPYFSTSTFSPVEIFQPFSPSFGQHGSASPSEVFAQTTQPIFNGEIRLQPSYTSEVIPLVTPLSDTQFLKATPTASDIGLTLHVTPVFPNVDVSFEPSLSSSDGIPLHTFSSAFATSKMSRHHAVSEMFSQVTQTVATDTLSLHVSLALPETNVLVQPSQTHHSDVTPHQTAHAASEILTFGHEGDTFNNVQFISQLETPSTDLKMHALSVVSEPAYSLSNNVASTESFAITSDSSVFLHDSVWVFHQGTLITKLSTELYLKPSTVITPEDVLLQPTHSTIHDGENSETFSGSGFFFDGIDGLKSHNETSPAAVVNVKYTTLELNQSESITASLKVDDTGSQTTSTYGEIAPGANHEVMADLSSSNVIRETQSSPDIHSVSLPTARNFEADINAMSENLLPVQPVNSVTTTYGDILLKTMLAAASKTVSASTDMLLLPTQEIFYETLEKATNESLTQMASQLPNTSIALAVPSVGELNETSSYHYVGSNTGSLLLPSSVDATSESLLHTTYVQSVYNSLSPSSVEPAYAQQTMSVLHENVVEPHFFTNVHSDEIVSLSHDNGLTVQPVDTVPFLSPAKSHAVSTPVLPVNRLTQQDATLYYHTPPYAYPTHGISVVSSQYSKGSVLSTSALDTEAKESVLHHIILQNVYVSVTADSPNSESPSTLSVLTATTQTPTDVLSTVSSDTKTGPSVVDDGYLVVAITDSTSHTESQESVVADVSSYVQLVPTKNNLSLSEPSETAEEGSALSTAASDIQISPDPEERSLFTTPSTEPKKQSDMTLLETHIQTEYMAVENTSESNSWAVLTGDEESGSGQSTSDSLSDNETSTDFNFSDLNDRDKDFEVAVEPGKADLTPGSEMSTLPSITSDRSTVANVSEAEFSNQEASNSSHESRVGLAEGLESREKAIIPLVVVSSLTFICLVVLVGILIYWRKCFQTAHFYLEDSTSPRVITSPPAPVFPVSDDVGAIPLKQFPRHVRDLHSNNGFAEEFEEVQNCTADLGITADNSNHPENKNKNRYINIVAYDHSRVRLSQMGEKEGKITDYINANFVDGYNKPKAYIAAQGPLKSTAEDFWRMIWEHSVEVIVMITNLVEKGRRKCDQYWPSDGSEEYGTFLITQKSVQVLAYYTVRIFTLRNTKIKKGSQKWRGNEHVVTHYHYTQWPDMGVPEYALPVLTFVRKASATKQSSNGPVVVHCSAGVGRTGTYIVLDSMLQQIQQEGTVNIFGFLKHIRSQRNYLVQTEEQYIFIHDALVEAILSRETEVPENHIHAYVNALLTTGPSGKTRLEMQFKLLSEPNILQCDYSTALRAQNRDKNRTSSIIPVEQSRVGLPSLVGDGIDYINASYIMGYHESNEFIITQHPLLHTIKDFWRMIWDHNSQTIVMFVDNPNMAEAEFVYWPNKDEPIACENFTVSMVGEDHICLSNEERMIIQDFILEATQDDYVLEVKHFHCPKWPNPDSQISKTFELINLIKEEAANKDGPIVVHDEYGGVTAGTFCALSTLMNQLEKENSVDVYQVTKMINLMRPGLFSDIDQYQFLYKAILSLVSSRQEESPAACLESNGSALPDGNTLESLESLV